MTRAGRRLYGLDGLWALYGLVALVVAGTAVVGVAFGASAPWGVFFLGAGAGVAGALAAVAGARRTAGRRAEGAFARARPKRASTPPSHERRSVEQALSRERSRYVVTLASIGDGVVTTDTKGFVTYLNPVAEELMGWPLDEAQGQPLERVFRILNEQSREPVSNPVREVLRGGFVVGLANHTLLVARDGTERAIDDSASPIRGSEGAIEGAVLIFRDVSERRRAEAVALRLAAIVDHSEDAIFSKSLEGIIQSWNAGAERLYGYAPDEIVGRPVSVLVPEDRREELRRIMERLRRGESIEDVETVRLRKDGSPVEVSLRISPLRDAEGRLVGASGIARDITPRKRAERALRRSEQELTDFFENASIGLHWAGPDGTILRANRAELEMLGYSEEEYVGRHIAEFYEQQDEIDEMLRRLHAGETLRDHPARMRCKNGGVLDVRIDSSAYFEDGRFVHTRCFTRDVSKRVRSERAMRLLADASAALAKPIDYPGTLVKVARLAIPAFADWCAVDIVESDGSLRRVVVAHSDPAKEAQVREVQQHRAPPAPPLVLRRGGPVLIEALSEALLAEVTTDEEHRRLAREMGLRSYIGIPLQVSRRTLGVLSFATAESGRSYDAQDLTLAHDLARRAALAIESAELYAELRKSDRRKDEFLATLSHELRNPLAPIRNAVGILQRAPEDPELRRHSLALLDRQVQQLVRLIDDLLEVSRITLGKLELRRERVTLVAVLENALETSRPLIEAAGQKLVTHLPEEILVLDADLTRLAQVFGNLLANASKYTASGGRIDLGAERQSEHVLVRVRDEGVGIAPEVLPHIFEMFTQAPVGGDGTQGGLGIGLALVRGLVELHGGEVGAHSDGPGRGSEFWVRLPLAAERCGEAAAAVSERRSAAAQRPRRLLVVDDNADAATTLQMLLEIQGHVVHTAYDGAEALEAAASFQPDLVLLDIGLPGLSGYEVAARLQARPGPQPLLVALTGWGQESDRRRSEKAGFHRHFVKPVDLEELGEVLRELDAREDGDEPAR